MKNYYRDRLTHARMTGIALKKQAEAIGMYILKTYLVRRQETGCGEMEFTVKVHEVNGQVKFDINEASDDHEA